MTSLLLSAPAFASWRMPEFLILYTYGWPAEKVSGLLTEQSAREIAAGHYNTVMCAPSELAIVARAGLRCLVIGRSQGGPDYIGEAVSPSVAHGLANNPAVWGYYVTDEPDNRNWKRGTTFPQLASRLAEYRAADPNHVAWINMTSATGRFLADYMEVVKPDLLSFDQYRWWWGKESDWYNTLEAHRDAALKAGVPLILWIEWNTSEKRFNDHLPPPEGNATKIRWSLYTSLAYGSKGVQWFAGTTNPEVVDLNEELSVLGPTLIGLESRHVFHTSDVPRDGQRLPASSWYFTDTQNLLIGEFGNPGERNSTYFLITNKSIDSDVNTTIQFRQRVVSVVEEVNRKSAGRTALTMDNRGGVMGIRLHLAPGDGRLIRVETR